MSPRDKVSGTVIWFAVFGTVSYLVLWLGCGVVMFGYEEQWIGPDEALYTLGSMTLVEQVAYVVGRYVLSFPAWPPQWFGVFSFNPAAALCSGAVVGGAIGWLLDRRTHAPAEPAAVGRRRA